MAAALKTVGLYSKRAVVVAAKDGYLLWALSSKAAFKSGVYLATRKIPIPVPKGSSLNTPNQLNHSNPIVQQAQLWFPKEPADMMLVEHVYATEGYSLGLLELPEAHSREDYFEDALLKPLGGYLREETR